jgi:hypothetical protein
VTNNTRIKRWLNINNDWYSIPAFSRRPIEIPSGNITTQYESEQEKYWHLGPANKYTQSLYLNP